ncbi:ATP-dependent DNA helicase sgs1, partial [Mortierella polycephala]
TIVYFDSGDDLTNAYFHLLSRIRASASQPSLLQSNQIAKYYADLAPETKQLYMSKFKRGEVRMLLSTEAAGMGCDISDILRVVQFRFPKTITVLAQRLGRAARDPNLQGSGILIYPRTDFHKLRTMEADLHDFIMTDCRRKHFNNVFENEHKTVTNCCDLYDDSLPTPNKPDYRMVRNTPRLRPSRKFKLMRHPEQQLVAKEKVKVWRSMELQELEKHSEIYDERCIMNDGAINLLSARFGDIVVAEDINSVIDWSELMEGSQQRLANILVEYNMELDNPVSPDVQCQRQERRHSNDLQNEKSPSESLPSQQGSQAQKRTGEGRHWTSEDHRNKWNKPTQE